MRYKTALFGIGLAALAASYMLPTAAALAGHWHHSHHSLHGHHWRASSLPWGGGAVLPYAEPIEQDYDVWDPPPPPPPNEPPAPVPPAYEAGPLTCKHSNEVKTVPREGGGTVQISITRC